MPCRSSATLGRHVYLYLTTKGFKSGRDHEIEIWFTELDGNYYVIAESSSGRTGSKTSGASRGLLFASGRSASRGQRGRWTRLLTGIARGACKHFPTKDMDGARGS